jgi:hypothetical protein
MSFSFRVKKQVEELIVVGMESKNARNFTDKKIYCQAFYRWGGAIA